MKLVAGVGINDADYAVTTGPRGSQVWCPAYSAWVNVIRRCYSEAMQKRFPTYQGCIVEKEWHSFMSFKSWFDRNYKEGWCLDKDLLVTGNKVYGPNTCIFVPPHVNTFLYQPAKGRDVKLLGTSLIKKTGKYRASIKVDYKEIYLGTRDTQEEAHELWKEAKLGILEEMKGLLDSIDGRLYISIKDRYSSIV